MDSSMNRFLLKKTENIDTITEVWATNFEYEMSCINNKLSAYPMIGLDSEFPGFLCNRPLSDPENLRYEDLVFNVNSLKLIQLGLTLFNEKGEIGGCWQINFSGFDLNRDIHVPESIQLLKRNGIDFEKNRINGVDPDNFTEMFNKFLSQHREYIKWVTFHGIYDMAYLTKILMKKVIPDSKSEFVNMVGNAMGCVIYDVKLMAGRRGYLGLQKMSEELAVERVGQAHQAGPDSLLTAKVFMKLSGGGNKFDLINYEGYLFGFNLKICSRVSYQAETSRIQGGDEIEKRTIELLQCIYGENYPMCVVPQQFYGSREYYVTPQEWYSFTPIGACYSVPGCSFYPI